MFFRLGLLTAWSGLIDVEPDPTNCPLLLLTPFGPGEHCDWQTKGGYLNLNFVASRGVLALVSQAGVKDPTIRWSVRVLINGSNELTWGTWRTLPRGNNSAFVLFVTKFNYVLPVVMGEQVRTPPAPRTQEKDNLSSSSESTSSIHDSRRQDGGLSIHLLLILLEGRAWWTRISPASAKPTGPTPYKLTSDRNHTGALTPDKDV
ncbi:hypothetical protein K474DRAFT_1676327 [Panus rudis PR-1116 ss-1]|nr:hypothetical protein K474DRAFT_1676327 [Panus rudis PR-1116 ss-1]